MKNDPNQFTRDAWEANAEVWDARMGDEGNDFFNAKLTINHRQKTNLQPLSASPVRSRP
jgi:hypothetical protein